MIRAGKAKSALVFFLIAISLTNAAFIKKIKTPETIFFDSKDVRKSVSYQKVLTAKEGHREEAKWQYLLDRIRKSPEAFLRNGTTFEGSKAAKHFLWKLSRRGRVIKTAEEFIDRIASESFASGNPYLVRIADKNTYPLRDILNNELRRLELYLEEDRQKVPKETKE